MCWAAGNITDGEYKEPQKSKEHISGGEPSK